LLLGNNYANYLSSYLSRVEDGKTEVMGMARAVALRILGMEYPISESDMTKVGIVLAIIIPFGTLLLALTLFIGLPLMGIHIPFNEAVEIILYFSGLLATALIIYLTWKMAPRR
jgi:hypothetical protein